jgi:hypothetical protein
VPEPLRLESDGITYRVFDAAMRDGRLIPADPPVPWATCRVFRPLEGHRRLYRILDGADRRVDEETLRRQLRAAEYLGTMPAGATDQDPR